MINLAHLIETVQLLLEQFQSLTKKILQETILKARPELATAYGNILTLLVLLTSIYLLLLLVNAFRKILGIILLLGWLFLSISMVLTVLTK